MFSYHSNCWKMLKCLRTALIIFSLLISLSEQSNLLEVSLLNEIPVLHTAFVQIGEELHYFGNQIRSESVQHLPVFNTETGDVLNNVNSVSNFNSLPISGKDELPLQMDPPVLDFGENSVGCAQKRTVYLRNTLDQEIVLDAIIVNSIEFQASFFEKFKLKPYDSTSLDFIFIPRHVGTRTFSAHFYTSIGMFTYKLTGSCVTNPYRISPFVGYKLPFNGNISKQIVLHNPHPYKLRITEINTSGGNAHVELPHGPDPRLANEPSEYWDIYPYESKHISNIRFIGALSENTTSFVRISAELHRTKSIMKLEDIVIAIPIEVTLKRGVFATEELLDFGYLRVGERSNSKMFSVFQNLPNGRLEFETIYVENGDPNGIHMEFASNPPIVVHSSKDTRKEIGPVTDLVKVYYDASVPLKKEKKIWDVLGSIVAVSRGGNYNISIPFKSTIFTGELKPVGNDLSIQSDLRPPHQRMVRIYNELPFDIAIYNLSLSSDASQHFAVRLFRTAVYIRSEDVAPAFILKYFKKISQTFNNGIVYVHTNVSTFRLPINQFSGDLKVELSTIENDVFDFGCVERNDTRTIRFTVWNDNNAEMVLHRLTAPNRNVFRLYEVGVQIRGNYFSGVSDEERDEYVQPTDVDISPNSGKIFDLELKVPQDGTEITASIVFETDFVTKIYEIRYNVVVGSLQSIPDEISFGQTFPGRLVYRTLQVFNSFDEDMTVMRLTTLNRDPRFFFERFDEENPPLLRSGRLTNLGRVMFSPKIPCTYEYCYLGFPFNNNDGQWFVHGLTLPSNLAEVDLYLYNKQRYVFDKLRNEGKHLVNTTIVLDTDKAKNIKVKTTAEMVWPRLLTHSAIHFPLTALGNFTIINLTLSNPTSVPVAVQVIPLVIYPDADTLIDLLRPHISTSLPDHLEMNETLMFSLRDTELFNLKDDSPVPDLREELESNIPHSVPRFTLSMMLKPHMKVRLRIGFLPTDYHLRTSLLLIRNNLTAIEPVVLYGKGARIGVKVENIEARSKKPLLFEIRSDHLTDCNNPKRLMHKLHSTLTVRRPFQVLNSGEVQFTVTNMSVNGVPCENRGFRILNCYPFRLQPNETYALDIAYTPDFLTTTNEADLQLYMHMNGSAWVFPLAATVPSEMLAKCHQALPRPPFENIMYYSCVTALIFCLVCVLACAYLEGDRAVACAIRQQYTIPRHVFDLKNLGGENNQGRRLHKNEEEWNDTPSTLRVASDAWLVWRILIGIANWVVHCVYAVWKLSLFCRKDKTEESTAKNNKRKKRNPVTMVKRKEKIEKAPEPVEKNKSIPNNSNAKKSSSTNKKSSKSPKIQLPKKKVQEKEQVGREDSMKRKKEEDDKKLKSKKKEEVKKVECTEPDNVRAKKGEAKKEVASEKNVALEEPSVSQNTPSTLKPSENITVEPQRNTEESAETERDNTMLHYTDPNIVALMQDYMSTAAVIATDTNRNTPNPNVWTSPLGSVAMQYLNLGMPWMMTQPIEQQLQSQVVQPQQLIEDKNNTNEPLKPEKFLHEQQQIIQDKPNDNIQSQLREASSDDEVPDWADEDVHASDAEIDFSTMSVAANNMLSDMEDRSIDKVKGISTGERRLTIGSEKKRDFSKTPGHVDNRVPQFRSGPENSSRYGLDSTLSSYWQEAETFDPLTPTTSGTSIWSNEQTSLFSGREFNLWSDSTFDPKTAWTNLGLPQDENKDSKAIKKKDMKKN